VKLSGADDRNGCAYTESKYDCEYQISVLFEVPAQKFNECAADLGEYKRAQHRILVQHQSDGDSGKRGVRERVSYH